MSSHGHAGYLEEVFNPHKLKKTVRLLSNQIRKDIKELGINSIACTGVSGNIIAGALSFNTGLPVIAVRKGEDRHSWRDVEVPDIDEHLRYCFIDDFIAYGHTLERVYKAISKVEPDSELVKIYLYHKSSYDDTVEVILNKVGKSIPLFRLWD